MIKYAKHIKYGYYFSVVTIGIYAIRKTWKYNIQSNSNLENVNRFARYIGETDSVAISLMKILITMYIFVIMFALLLVRVDGLHE